MYIQRIFSLRIISTKLRERDNPTKKAFKNLFFTYHYCRKIDTNTDINDDLSQDWKGSALHNEKQPKISKDTYKHFPKPNL